MSFKKMDADLSFTDIALINSPKRNRTTERRQQINPLGDWSRPDRILTRIFPIGKNVLAQETDKNPSITEMYACAGKSERR